MSKHTTITLPSSVELDLTVEKELVKLPSESIHNHLHTMAEGAKMRREGLEQIELASLLLCALELDHQKEVNHGLPWKEWVKQNCEFTHMTATKYAKLLKCAKAGMIDNLDPSIIPNVPPSLMGAAELADAGRAIAASLQGLGGIRQLYLKLEIIKTPQRSTIEENRNTEGAKTNEEAAEETSNLIDQEDAEELLPRAFEDLHKYFQVGHHQHLQKAKVRELDDTLQSYRDLLKPLID